MSGALSMMTLASYRTASFIPSLVYDLDAANFSGFPSPGGSIATGNNMAIRPPVSSEFTYGTGDFTVEWWSYQTATNGVQGIWRNSTGDATHAVGFWTITQAGGRLVVSLGNGVSTDTIQSNDIIATNTWHHYAFVRNGNSFKLYVDGVAQTQTLTSTINLPAQVGFMQIGNAGGNYYGYVTNFRIVKGTAVYTSNFTPSTRPLKAISGTSLLLLVWGSTPLLDSSPHAHTVTNSASTYNAASPFSTINDATGTYAITLNNAGSLTTSPQRQDSSAEFVKANLSTLSATVTAPSTDSITYEWWFRASSVSGTNGMLQTRTDTSGGDGIDVWVADGTIGVSSSGAFLLQGAGTVLANTWYHIAVVRNGTTNFTVYLDGTSIGTFSRTGLTSTQLRLGIKSSGSSSEAFAGYMTNFRYVKGTAVYTAAFTPPELPPTAISGTDLLLRNIMTTDTSANSRAITNSNVTSVSANPYPGYWGKTSNVGTDWIRGGPDYTNGQSYTVFMAYKLSATTSGRLLNTNSEASKDWYMGSLNGNPNAFYPNFAVNQPASGADTVWHLDWATWDNSTNTGRLYTSTNTAPTNYSYTATNASGGGFNQLRMFNRIGALDTQSGNIGFVKVYNYVLTLAEIQDLHATHKARFGY
jgi:hypothetical protein